MSRVHKLSLGLLMAAVAWQVAGNAIDTAMAQDAGAEGTESGMAPAAQTDPLIERGRYVATASNCVSCHSAPSKDAFAGGVAFVTDFGTIYSTNITSDPAAGIGSWTFEQFTRAMREGIDAEGEHLYPAFPYPSFAKITDDDLTALYAYLKTIPASPAKPPENEMGFPFNQRGLMAVWNTLFFDGAPFQADSTKSEAWNRGAYLVEGLGHCGACHTPRNFLGAEDNGKALAGSVLQDKVVSGQIRRWAASNLTQAKSGLAAWTEDDIFAYLKTGHSARAGTFGPMDEVIGNSTMRLTDDDARAMAVYLKDLAPIETSSAHELSTDEKRRGDTLYSIHCGTCHLPTGLGATPGSELGPPLAGSAVVQAADPSSLINNILYGTKKPVELTSPSGWQNMKPLGNTLRDEEVAAIATFVRGSWGNLGGPVTADQVAKQR
ncbi:MAG: cytochrome c [Rhodobacteraceae bacterium]|nr:cytochrome c [Paracoccaceae bacterium]